MPAFMISAAPVRGGIVGGVSDVPPPDPKGPPAAGGPQTALPSSVKLDPEQATTYLAEISATTLRAVIAKLDELDALDCYRMATAFHHNYLESSYQMAAIRAQALASALVESGLPLREFAAKVGLHESRVRQIVAQAHGQKRPPQVKKKHLPDPSAPPGAVRRKRRAPGTNETTVPLPAELRHRLEQISKDTGASANSLILLGIASLLEQVERGGPLPERTEQVTPPPPPMAED